MLSKTLMLDVTYAVYM